MYYTTEPRTTQDSTETSTRIPEPMAIRVPFPNSSFWLTKPTESWSTKSTESWSTKDSTETSTRIPEPMAIRVPFPNSSFWLTKPTESWSTSTKPTESWSTKKITETLSTNTFTENLSTNTFTETLSTKFTESWSTQGFTDSPWTSNVTDSWDGEPGEVRQIADYLDLMDTVVTVYYYIITPIGLLFTIWLLTCLSMSRELHSRMRVKLFISTMVVVFLSQSINQPIYIHITTWYIHNCDIKSPAFVIDSVTHAIFNWSVVQILIVHLAQVSGVDPSQRMTRSRAKKLTVVFLAVPWVVSSVVIPTTHHITPYARMGCTDVQDIHKLHYLTIFVPLITSLVVVGVTVWRRVRRAAAQAEQVDDGLNLELVTEEVTLGLDPLTPHVLMVAAMLIDVPCAGYVIHRLVSTPEITKAWIMQIITLSHARHLVALKHILIPATFLMYADVRENAIGLTRKLWRKIKMFVCCWRQRGIELTVHYRA